jgi:hypothetical protein
MGNANSEKDGGRIYASYLLADNPNLTGDAYLQLNPRKETDRQAIAKYHDVDSKWKNGKYEAPTGNNTTPIYNLLYLVKKHGKKTNCIDAIEGFHRLMFITHLLTQSSMNEVTGEIVPHSLTGEDMLSYFSDADFNKKPDRKQTSAMIDKALSTLINSKPDLNDPLTKPTGIEFNWALKKKNNAPTARKIIAHASQISRSIFINKTACARPTLMKELGRFLTTTLPKIDVSAQLSTLDTHGFFSPANQIKISHHKKTRVPTRGPIESSELDNPTEVYTKDVYQDYIKSPFPTQNDRAFRELLAAAYDKPDEDDSVSSDNDDDDDHPKANESEIGSTKVLPPYIAPWSTIKEMPPHTVKEGFADRHTVNFMYIAVPVIHILYAHKKNQSVHATKNDQKLVNLIHYFLEQHAGQYNSANPFFFSGIGATAFGLPNTDTIADEESNVMGAAYFITKLVTSGLSLIGETPSDDSSAKHPSEDTVTANLKEFINNLKSVFMFHDCRSPQMTALQVIADLGKCVSIRAIKFRKCVPLT